MEIVRYPDGSSYAKLNNNSEHNFTYRLNSYEDLIHLAQILEVFNSQNRRPIVTIPNLIDAQADRRFDINQSNGLKVVTKILNSYHAKFKIFHPHNPEVVEALMDNVEIIDNSEFIFKVIKKLYTNSVYHVTSLNGQKYELNSKYDFNNLILMSSDAGGFKPLMKLCDKIKWTGQTASASKSRLWDGKTSRLVQNIQCNDFEGKDILIVDDICIYGGTFKGLATMLKERNCGKLYLAVSHITVQNHEKNNVFSYFDKVFTTNSKYDIYYERIDGSSGKQIKNLEIINLF